jgi:SAM-dependent methyltransferase
MPFTGERLTSAYGGQTEIEHLHRYLLARELCREKDILDVASGEGYGTALLAQVARTATGIEIAQDAVEHAVASYSRPNLRYHQGDARTLRLPDASFDVVISFETIEHFTEHERFLLEIRRVLRSGGLLIVSTPDRDNYSPAETPANPYHSLELTIEEFRMLLARHFDHVETLTQRPMFGSVMLPGGGSATAPWCFEQRGTAHFEASRGLARPQYVVAFASDKPIEPPSPTVYIDTGRLGMLNPSEAADQLARARQALEAERASASAELDQIRGLVADAERRAQEQQESHLVARAEVADLRERLAAAQADREAMRAENLALLHANEMAEQAVAVLRVELLDRRTSGTLREQEIAEWQARSSKAEHQLHERVLEVGTLHQALRELRTEANLLETRLKHMFASHSWKITAPVRAVSRMVWPRP